MTRQSGAADATGTRCDLYRAGQYHAEKMIHRRFFQRLGAKLVTSRWFTMRNVSGRVE